MCTYILGPPKDVVATSMEDVLLTCDLDLDPRMRPATEVSWSKDGEVLKVDLADDFGLRLAEVMRPESQGEYRCTAANSMGDRVERTTR